MARIHEVKLELVRPGPTHNQLLSPLTSYMALCGESAPTTLRINLEHHQLLNRLASLRYFVRSETGAPKSVPERIRSAQMRELSEEMGQIFAQIPSLNAELALSRNNNTSSDNEELIHLRIVLYGSELSILPLEIARAPQSFPGEGLDLTLQGNLPIVVTRESRRRRPLPATYAVSEPKILFAFADPAGFDVPKHQHLRTLRRAIAPWIQTPDHDTGLADPQKREMKHLEDVKKHLRVLPHASIDSLCELCATENFTHVHILAHGMEFETAGERKFGIALCHPCQPSQKQIVTGKQLAYALCPDAKDGSQRTQPLFVTLAMCDSGTQGSILVPGGSIAHDLHAAGIPWVVASQFPLTKRGSVRMAKFLYNRLLRGDDPRRVLYALRQQLAMSASDDHDWAAIIAFAAADPNLDQQVTQFFQQQTVRAIEVQLGIADKFAEQLHGTSTNREEFADQKTAQAQISAALEKVDMLLSRWEKRIPKGNSFTDRHERAYWYGMKGSTLKRMGILHGFLEKQEEAKTELNKSLEAYRNAMDEWVTEEARFNWTATQYLALNAILKTGEDPDTLAVCRKLAERDLSSPNRELRAWANATLAELKLIGSYHCQEKIPSKQLEKEIVGFCQKVVELTSPESFAVHSTRRQFQRYVDNWRLSNDDPQYVKWRAIAQQAVEALSSG